MRRNNIIQLGNEKEIQDALAIMRRNPEVVSIVKLLGHYSPAFRLEMERQLSLFESSEANSFWWRPPGA